MSVMKTETIKRTPNAELDLVLVNKVRAGDTAESEKAFTAIFDKYHTSIFFHLKKFVNDDIVAQDLAMVAFEKMHKNIIKFDEDQAAFSTWMFALTKNIFIDMLRKRKIELISIDGVARTNEEGETYGIEFDSGLKNPEEILEEDERNTIIRKVIDIAFKDKLQLKELIELRYFAEMTYDEMVILTGRPIGTVKAHLHRAKIILKEACIKANLSI